MIKQAAGPPSPPESVVLTAPAAAAETSAGPPGASPAGVSNPTESTTNGNGAKVFANNCSSCHGATGQGVPGTFPPLAGNPIVTGDPNKVIGIVLGGLNAPITVNGQSYHGMMPPWKGTLSNKDIADVITYIRSSLGTNKASAVTEAQVAGFKP
jgi:mono/diheme cytochrome c family protein